MGIYAYRACRHCGVSFESRSCANWYCPACVPPGNRRAQQNMSKYKLGWSEWEAMLFEQDGLCYLCKDREARCMDHDHACCPSHAKTCGRCLRAILCVSCNTQLGWYETGWGVNKDFERLAVPYVDEWSRLL